MTHLIEERHEIFVLTFNTGAPKLVVLTPAVNAKVRRLAGKQLDLCGLPVLVDSVGYTAESFHKSLQTWGRETGGRRCRPLEVARPEGLGRSRLSQRLKDMGCTCGISTDLDAVEVDGQGKVVAVIEHKEAGEQHTDFQKKIGAWLTRHGVEYRVERGS